MTMLLDTLWTVEAQARLFRAVLAAHAYPGEVVDCRAWLGGRPALAGVLAALADAAVTIADLDGSLDPVDADLIQACPAAPQTAAFVVASGALVPTSGMQFCRGELLAPERGATLLLVCQAVGEGPVRLELSGPGVVESGCRLAVAGLDPAWLDLRTEHNRQPPLGIDLVLCDGARIAALPRTTSIQVG